MDSALAAVRLILAALVAGSALAALAHAGATRRAAAGGFAVLDLAIATTLMFGETAWWSALAALGRLLVPTAALAVGMARGRLGGNALSPIVRNLMLAIPAAVVLVNGYRDGGPDIAAWMAGLSPGQQVCVGAGAAALAIGSSGVRPWHGRAATPPPADARTADRPARPSSAALVHPGPELTIGMATYDDFDGVYFTLQALRLYHDLDRTELVVVDNYGCGHTRNLVRDWVRGTYVLATDVVGTAATKDLVFRHASGRAVLCCDSHVLFAPGAIARLRTYHREHPECADLLQGPLLYDDGELVSTHFEPVWRGQMWGTWATDPRGSDGDGDPFEIPMQGLGVFSCRTDAWPGFHPGFRGFGGEEGYLHEKFRQAGGRCLCLPWLRWMHRFGRPRGPAYPLTIEDKLRNYVLGHSELGLDISPVLAHFSEYLPPDRVLRVADAAVSEGPP
ncbi:MAG TPA: glycosyltransferase family A protein [Jiangellales bacterium]|nr:glycosyltransferase family A protein [Jiangellales bacterium]